MPAEPVPFSHTLETLFGANAAAHHSFPGFEPRAGQLTMAEAVASALGNEHILLCEAGTGTGKTLAYLVPAILSGKKVVISTATRTLQDQIAFHDLPQIEKHLGLKAHAAVLKGLGNYLCLRRYDEFRRSGLAPPAQAALAYVEAWRERTSSGDLAELDEQRLGPIGLDVASSSDTRVGPGCGYFDGCFVTRAKREADAAQLVIVNHHLFFADLALRGPHPARVLPDYDAVIFDEAHHLEAAATQFFGSEVSSGRITALLGEIERMAALVGNDAFAGRTLGYTGKVRQLSAALFRGLEQHAGEAEGEITLDAELWVGPLRQAYFDLDAALDSLVGFLEGLANQALAGEPARPRPYPASAPLAEAFLGFAGRSLQVRAELGRIVDGARGNVSWFSRGKRSQSIGMSPIDLSETFAEKLFEIVPSVVLTSATLTSSATTTGQSVTGRRATDFSFIRQRLGLGRPEFTVRELALPSPFDFPSNVLFYVPRDLPLPGVAGASAAQRERILALLRACDGGALLLSTSFQSMHELARIGSALEPGRSLLVQGTASKRALLDEFRNRMNAVLVATMSFWEGVDVPGRALRLVVIDRIPFPVPGDPLLKARSEAIEKEGRRAFVDLHLPLAQITLKQGFGRLIRHHEDWGVVALLDGRVYERSYGRKLLEALPPAARTNELEQVVAFFEEHSKPS